MRHEATALLVTTDHGVLDAPGVSARDLAPSGRWRTGAEEGRQAGAGARPGSRPWRADKLGLRFLGVMVRRDAPVRRRPQGSLVRVRSAIRIARRGTATRCSRCARPLPWGWRCIRHGAY